MTEEGSCVKMPKKGLAIDIGSEKIKIIQYHRNKDKLKVLHSVVVSTPTGIISDGLINDKTKLSTIIREELEAANIREKDVVFTVASSKIITREVDLPELKANKLDTLIKMNSDEYFPVNLADYTLDYTIIEHIEGEPKQVKVNIIAALTSLLSDYHEVAMGASLRLAGIDYAGNSSVSFAMHQKIQGTYMLLDLGSDTTMVTIMNEGVPRFSRNLVYGTRLVNNSIQNHFGVDYAEAVKIAKERVLLSDEAHESDFLSGDVTGAMNQILNGISRLIDYYTSRNKDNLSKVYLVGGGTQIQGIADYVEHFFNIKTEIIKEFHHVTATEEAFRNQNFYFANVVGAVYSKVNLLPKAILNKDKYRAQKRVKYEIALLGILALVVITYLPFAQVQNLNKEKERITTEIETKKIIQPILDEHALVSASRDFREMIYATSNNSSETLVAVFELMEKEIPQGISYLNLVNTETGMMISCVSTDKLTSVNLLKALKALTLDDKIIFQKVFIPAISESTSESGESLYYTFSITCDYTTLEVQP